VTSAARWGERLDKAIAAGAYDEAGQTLAELRRRVETLAGAPAAGRELAEELAEARSVIERARRLALAGRSHMRLQREQARAAALYRGGAPLFPRPGRLVAEL